ncbi:MAG: PEP-CTERM sorting domain-containing protein [Opitutales bacterium]
MKKYTYIAAASLLSVAAANAQSLIAGWDFTDVTDYSGGLPFISAETTDLAPDVNAGNFGAVHFDGQFGSTDSTGGSNVVYSNNPAGLASNADITTRPLPSEDFSGSNSLLLDGYTAGFPGNVVIAVNAGSAFNTWGLSYAAGIGGSVADGVTLDWEYSFDGSNYLNLGSDAVAGGDEGGSFFGFADATASSEIFFRLSFTGLNDANAFGDEFVLLDNVAVYGTVVPEPSAFAALAGVIALGFVAIRRRK